MGGISEVAGHAGYFPRSHDLLSCDGVAAEFPVVLGPGGGHLNSLRACRPFAQTSVALFPPGPALLGCVEVTREIAGVTSSCLFYWLVFESGSSMALTTHSRRSAASSGARPVRLAISAAVMAGWSGCTAR
jgi:hypothetical protein